MVQEDICNGCGYCVPACPYGVIDRRIGDQHTKNAPKVKNEGLAQKCTLCYDRLGNDQTPACAQACPTAVDPVRPPSTSCGSGRSTGSRHAARQRPCRKPVSTGRIRTVGPVGRARSSCCWTSRRCTGCHRIPSSPPPICHGCGSTPGWPPSLPARRPVAAVFAGRRERSTAMTCLRRIQEPLRSLGGGLAVVGGGADAPEGAPDGARRDVHVVLRPPGGQGLPVEADIPAYLFLGGVAAGSSLLAAGADLTNRPALRRAGRAGPPPWPQLEPHAWPWSATSAARRGL